MTNQTQSIQVNQPAEVQEQTERIRERRMITPRTDIYETKNELVVVMDVPGVDDRSVEIVLDKNVLTITAFPVFDRPQGYTLAYAEYGEADFRRSFTLPEEVDRKNISAHVQNGVLTLTLAKAPESKPTRIAVKPG